MRTEGRRPGSAGLAVVFVLIGTGALWFRFNAVPRAVGAQFPSDLLNYFYPLAVQAADRLSHGELPLWNPYACSGIPLLATAQVGVFYPGNWLALLLPVEQALPLRVLLECFCGGLFTAFWLYRIGLRPVSGALAGILFVYACLLGQSFWPPQVATMVWLPWLLLCVESLCRARRFPWRWWIGLGLGVAFQLVAGFAQYAVYTWLLLPLYASVRLPWGASAQRGPSVGRRAFSMAGALALGAGLAGVQILPSLELVGRGLRGETLGPGSAHYLSAMGLGGTGAEFLANALDPSPKLTSFDFKTGSGYLGIAPLLLAAVALVAARHRRLVWLLLAVGALSLALSFGYRGVVPGLYELWATLPTVGWFRAPERLRGLYLFCGIALAALGLDAVARGLEGVGTWRGRVALGSSVLVAGVVAVLGPWTAGWRAGVSLALVLLAGLGGRPAWLPALCAWALAVFAVGDVVHATGEHGSLRRLPLEWARSYHFLGTTAIDPAGVAALRDEVGLGRIELLRMQPLTPAPPIAGLYRISCYEPLAPDPWPELTRRLGREGSLIWGHFLFDLSPERAGSFYDAAGVRAIIAPSEALTDVRAATRRWRQGLGPAPIAPDAAPERRPRPRALPRAYVIEQFVVRETSEALDLVADGGLDFHRIVVLDRAPGFASPGAEGRPARAAEIHAYTPERVEVEVVADRDALLVLSDSFYPGWQAAVDGEPAEILRANGLYRAVPVGAGIHRVVMEYRPASLRLGALCSVVSLALLLGLPVAVRARRRGSADRADADRLA